MGKVKKEIGLNIRYIARVKAIKDFFKITFFLIISFMMICPDVHAGEEMKAGSVIKEDSYVFTMEEARKLKSRIEELEKKEKELAQYKMLEKNLSEQNANLTRTTNIYKEQIAFYEEINKNNKEYIERASKLRRLDNLEKMGMFVAGTLIVSLSFRLATAE